MERFKNSAPVAAVVVALLALMQPRPAHAVDPPWLGCRPASKVEYQSAKQQYLLNNRFGMYVRTGGFLHRSYWYCPR